MVFTKENTLQIKGIAIILMLFHHCFNWPGMYENISISFFPLTESIVNNISWFGKICVSIFCFLSAYGLTISYNNNRKAIDMWYKSRLIQLFKNYWFVYIIAIVVCSCIDQFPFYTFWYERGIWLGTAYFFLDWFGLSGIFDTPSLNGSWWYMSLALVIIIFIPVIIELIKKFGWMPITVFVIIIPGIFGMEYRGNNGVFTFMLPVILGGVFSEYNLMEKIAGCVFKYNRVGQAFLFVLSSIVLYFLYHLYMILPIERFYNINYGIIPIYFVIYSYLFIVRIPIIDNILKYLGNHSMNIFYVHIFVRSNYGYNFIYSMRNCFLTIAVLLGVSLVLSIMMERLKKILNGIGKGRLF